MKTLLLTLLLSLCIYAQEAQPFTLPQLSDSSKTVSMKHFKNKVILLNIWASWCDGCRKEMPILNTLSSKIHAKNFKVVIVNVDNKTDKAQRFLNKMVKKTGPLTVTSLYDAKKSLPKAYQARGLPMSLLIKNNKVIKTYVGSFSDDDEAALIQEIKNAL